MLGSAFLVVRKILSKKILPGVTSLVTIGLEGLLDEVDEHPKCLDKIERMMKIKHLLFIGLGLVFFAIGLRLIGIPYYHYFLIAGISLKVIYLTIGLLNGTLAAGRYLVMLFAGIGLVGTGSYFNDLWPDLVYGSLVMGAGFLLKAASIVFMVVVGRKRRMAIKPERYE